MRIIVDECLPNRLCKVLVGHEAILVQKAGYSGSKDKLLLEEIKGEFDAFITIDGNLAYQQNLLNYTLGVIVFRASTNAFEDVEPLVPQILMALRTLGPGQVVHIG